MPPDKFAKLRAIGQDPEINFRVTLKRIYAESCTRLDVLARSVRECKSVNEASNFCRWLQFSGVLDLLQSFPLHEIDYRVLDRKIKDIIYDCGELYKGGKADAKYGASDIAEINQKLDALTRLAGLTVGVPVVANISPVTVETTPAGYDASTRLLPAGDVLEWALPDVVAVWVRRAGGR